MAKKVGKKAAGKKVAKEAAKKAGQSGARVPGLPRIPTGIRRQELLKSVQILKYTVSSVNSFYEEFSSSRGGRKGASTHGQQDQLRAMIVFAAAGLDALLKQLVKDALRTVCQGPSDELDKFVQRQLRGEEDYLEIDRRFLAGVLLDGSSPREALLDRFIGELTSSSLQSKAEVFKIMKSLSIDPVKDLSVNANTLDRVFDARNTIIHEMDIDFARAGGQPYPRCIRTREDAVEATVTLLTLGADVLRTLDVRLGQSQT